MKEGGREPGRQVPVHVRIDVLGGVLVCLVAAAIWMESAGLAVGELRNFGPGFLPRIFAIMLAAGGLALIVTGITQPDAAAERLVLAVRGPAAVAAGIFVFAVSVKGAALGPVTVPELGLLVAGPLTVLIAGMGSAEASPRELVVLGFGLTALAVLVFTDLLGMPVPVFPAIIDDNLSVAWGPDWPRRAAAVAYLVIAYGAGRLFGLTFEDFKASGTGGPQP